MKTTFKITLGLLVIMTFAGTASARTFKAIQRSSLIFGMRSENPPFGKMKNEDGVELKIAAAIAKEMGVRFRVVSIESIQEGEKLLKQNKIDAILGSYKFKKQSGQPFLLSQPYYISGLGALIPSTDTKTFSLTDLQKKYIATTPDSDAREFINTFIPGSKVEMATSITNALTLVKSGDVAAVIHDKVVLDYYQKNYSHFRVLDQMFTEIQYVIAVNRDFPEVLERLNNAIQKLQTADSPTAPSKLDIIFAEYKIKNPLRVYLPQAAISTTPSSNSDNNTTKQPNLSLQKQIFAIEKKILELQLEVEKLKQHVE